MADLDPSATAFLDRLADSGAQPAHVAGVEGARAAHVASAATLAGPGPAVAEVTDADADGVPVRVYRPGPPGEARNGVLAGAGCPLVVYLHGAGWVAGSVETYDTLCRTLCREAGAVVVSVDYRLAPEARYPAQLDDAWAALRWARHNAGRLGADPAWLMVAGDSAGGALAAITARRARDEGLHLAAQVLIYPILDATVSSPSTLENADGYYLTLADLRWYWDQYLPPSSRRTDPDVSPAHAEELAGVAPALVLTAGFDPLRDEADAYAARLAAGGVPVHRLHYPGQIHGFVRCTALIPESLEALAAIGAFVRQATRGEPGTPAR